MVGILPDEEGSGTTASEAAGITVVDVVMAETTLVVVVNILDVEGVQAAVVEMEITKEEDEGGVEVAQVKLLLPLRKYGGNLEHFFLI